MGQSASREANRFAATQEMNSPHFMEPESSQDPATCPYPEPYKPSPCPFSNFLKIYFNIILHLRIDLPTALFPSGFATRSLRAPFLSPIRATRSSHLTLLDLITRIIFDEEYRS